MIDASDGNVTNENLKIDDLQVTARLKITEAEALLVSGQEPQASVHFKELAGMLLSLNYICLKYIMLS